jgi:hypothetical protein
MRSDRITALRESNQIKNQEGKMTVAEMRNKIVSTVSSGDYVSFAELMQACGGEARGDLTMELKDNLVLWSGVSQLFNDAFKLSLESIEPKPTTPLTYLIDGMSLNLPVAKTNRAYKHPHWLPVTFRLRGNARKPKY